jgi:hypothetical protein
VCEGGGGASATVLSSSDRTVRAPGLSDTFAKLSMPQTAQEVPLPPLFPTTSPRLLFATLYSRRLLHLSQPYQCFPLAVSE